VLDESSLFAADLIGADLRKASFEHAGLPRAKLSQTQLQGADLVFAQLQGADLGGAQLQGANLSLAQLRGANLSRAQLQGAGLLQAQLQGASLVGAQLRGASLSRAQLQGAVLVFAQLQGADLSGAQLQGAGLSRAQLQGADLGGAQLQGADLGGAQLWRASFDIRTNLGLSNLQGADFTTPLTEDDRRALHAALDASPLPTLWFQKKLLGDMLAADQSADQLRFNASPERQVLVDDPKNPLFSDIPTDWLITSPTPGYTSAFVALLADEIASGDPDIARGIARRAINGIEVSSLFQSVAPAKPQQHADLYTGSLYAAVACRLLANAGAKKVKLEQPSIDSLSDALGDKKSECEPAKPAAPH
jgi:uncharacterized protein YjbI with pentapeptide repeats